MKQFILLLLTLASFRVAAQSTTANPPVFTLSKTGTATTVTLKPYKPVKIKTADGRKLTIYDFQSVGDSAIVAFADTVSLREITSIKGKVQGDFWRKAGGNVLAVGSGAFGAASVAAGFSLMMYGIGAPYFLLAVPAFSVTYAGTKLAGPRQFNTTNKWTLQISTIKE